MPSSAASLNSNVVHFVVRDMVTANDKTLTEVILMKFFTCNVAAASLAMMMVVAVGCGASSKSPTSVTSESSTSADNAAQMGGSLNTMWNQDAAQRDKSRPSLNQAPPLGAAAGYAILAGSTITNTGLTIITGDLGLSPGSAVTGFPPGVVNGVKHVADPAAALAKLDLTTAYNNLAGRTLAPILVAGNLGGRTLAPGLYKSTSSLEISSGDLTLDAKGNRNNVFIFQIASTLTTTAGRKVILAGGAKASNIFWQVGSSATIGTTSVFKGSILADQSITLNTGATLTGRAMARIGAVTMATNTVVGPN